MFSMFNNVLGTSKYEPDELAESYYNNGSNSKSTKSFVSIFLIFIVFFCCLFLLMSYDFNLTNLQESLHGMGCFILLILVFFYTIYYIYSASDYKNSRYLSQLPFQNGMQEISELPNQIKNYPVDYNQLYRPSFSGQQYNPFYDNLRGRSSNGFRQFNSFFNRNQPNYRSPY